MSLKVIGVSLAFAGFAIGHKDSPDAILMKINEAYERPHNLQMTVTYRLYDDWSPSVATDQLVSVVKRQGSNSLTTNPSYETLEEAEYTIHVDHDDGLIAVSRRQVVEHEQTDWVKQSISAAVMYSSRVDEYEVGGTSQGMRFSFESGEYTWLDIEYNTTSFLLRRLVIYCNEDHYLSDPEKRPRPKVEIAFSGYDTQTVIERSTFSLQRYFQRGSDWELNTRYANYKLVSLLN